MQIARPIPLFKVIVFPSSVIIVKPIIFLKIISSWRQTVKDFVIFICSLEYYKTIHRFAFLAKNYIKKKIKCEGITEMPSKSLTAIAKNEFILTENSEQIW